MLKGHSRKGRNGANMALVENYFQDFHKGILITSIFNLLITITLAIIIKENHIKKIFGEYHAGNSFYKKLYL